MDEFERSMESLRQQRARMGRDHEEMKREMGRSRRRFETIFGIVLLVGAGVVVFGCWCLYHVLKAKRLVP